MRNSKFKFRKSALAGMLALSMVVQSAAGAVVPVTTVEAATDKGLTFDSITLLEGESTNKVSREQGAMYQFVLPTLGDVKATNERYYDYFEKCVLKVKQGGEWVPIDEVLTRKNSAEDVEATTNAYAIVKWSDKNFTGWGIHIKMDGDLNFVRFQAADNEEVYLDYRLQYVAAITGITIEDLDGNAAIQVGKGQAIAFDFDFVKLNPGAYSGHDLYDLLEIVAVQNGVVMPVEKILGPQNNGVWGYDAPKDNPDNRGYWYTILDEFDLRIRLKDDPSIYADYDIELLVGEKGKDPVKDDSSRNNTSSVTTKKEFIEEYGEEAVWADEFDGKGANLDAETGLDLDKWSYQLGDGTTVADNPGWGNAERQNYTKDAKNVKVEDGVLRITASYEDEGVASFYQNESKKYYSSARIVTKGDDEKNPLFTTTYGYVEASIALPATAGAWPAFWMLPQSTDLYGAWPVSGEIDIMETTGTQNNKACSTLHYGAPAHLMQGSGYQELSDSITKYHTYGMEWEPGAITFYYDGEEIYKQTNWESKIEKASDTLAFDAPFDQPYYILLNLAVDSGNFGGPENKATFQDDINMYVDYVRVYQKKEGYNTDNVRRTQKDSNKDWANEAGKNLIAAISKETLTEATDGDMNKVENPTGATEIEKVDKSKLDSKKWYLAYCAGGAATIESVTKNNTDWAKTDITSAGVQDYSTQLIGHYNAKKGYVYKVSFDAYAEGDLVGQTATADSKEWMGWGAFGSTSFMLEDEPRSYSFLIEQQQDFDNCRIEVNLGKIGTGTVYVGNMKVEVVDPALLGADSERESLPLATGEYLYNGTFDQGNDRIGHWTATEGTKISVAPSTTTDLTGSDLAIVDVAANLVAKAENPKAPRYYERRAQVSAEEGKTPSIYQDGFSLDANDYVLLFDAYSEKVTTVSAALYSVNTAEDGTRTLGTKLTASKAVTTPKEPKVLTYAWNIDCLRPIKDAAVVLTFGDGSTVQVDNVSLITKEQAATEGKAENAELLDDKTTNYIPIEYHLQDGPETPAENADSNPFYYVKGEGMITLAPATRKGFKFAGWATKPTAEYVEDYVTEVSTNVDSIKLYAQWGDKVTASNKVPVTGVTVDEKLELTVGNSAKLNVTVAPENASNKNVTYEPENKEIATVDEKGNVTAVKEGTTKITVKTEDGEKTAVCTVTVKAPVVPVESITVTPSELNLLVGDTSELKASVLPDNATDKNVTYEIIDQTIVSIEKNAETQAATVTALAAGTTDIVAKAGNKTAICRVNVSAKENAKDPKIEKIEDIDVVEGEDMKSIKVDASVLDEGTLSYEWYQKADNKDDKAEGGEVIPKATKESYTPSGLTAGKYYYYCVVTNTNDKATGEKTAVKASNVVEYEVKKAEVEIVNAMAPTVTAPQSAEYEAGKNAVPLQVTAVPNGEGKLTYQWYSNTVAASANGTPIAGATSATYTPDISAAGTVYYYCVVTNTNEAATGKKTASATSNPAKITAIGKDVSAPSILNQPVAGNGVYGQTATALSVKLIPSSDGTLSYQWYQNTTNAIAGATPIAGATAETYVPATTAVGVTYYFCEVTNTNLAATGKKAAVVNSEVVSFTVAKADAVIQVPATINKTIGNKAFNLNAVGVGKLTYSSSDSKIVKVGKQGKVALKNTGKAVITISDAGDANHNPATVKVTVNVKPKKVTSVKVKSNASGQLTVSWKQNSKTTGYEIQYATKSNFKSAKTVTITKNTVKKPAKTIVKLNKGKKYYVRVRAYKNKKKAQRVYSAWSAKKKITVKK